MSKTPTNTIIHVAKAGSQILLLRKVSDHHFQWYEDTSKGEAETPFYGTSPREALALAKREWKASTFFRFVHCGKRFTLPERDEHGENALFHQMVQSLESINGTYLDEELGHACIVEDISIEARELYRLYRKQERL